MFKLLFKSEFNNVRKIFYRSNIILNLIRDTWKEKMARNSTFSNLAPVSVRSVAVPGHMP